MAKIGFYIDESVNVAVAEGLKRRGIKVITAREVENPGLSDKEQLKYATKKNLAIVTHDDDFSSMAIQLEHIGIVYDHQQKYRTGDLIRNLKLLWDAAEQKDMINHIEFCSKAFKNGVFTNIEKLKVIKLTT